MEKYCGYSGRQILFVTRTRPRGKYIAVLHDGDDAELLSRYQVLNGKVVPKDHQMSAKQLRVAIVGAWGIPCGIATYTQYLHEKLLTRVGGIKVFTETLPNETLFVSDQIERCWSRGKPMTDLAKAIKDYRPDIVHIQHEYGIFPDARHWLALLNQLHDLEVFVTFHSVYRHSDKTICEAAVKNTIVHSEAAKRVLIDKGVSGNVSVITHGCVIYQETGRLWNIYRSKRTIIQFGFGFRYKGWEHSLETVAELKKKHSDVFFTGIFSTPVNDEGQTAYLSELNELARDLGISENVAIIPGFMKDAALRSYLRTNSVGLFPYISNPEHEVCGASGAARIAMANDLPVVGSPMHHFDDLNGVVPRPKTIKETTEAIERLWENPVEQIRIQRDFLRENSWDVTAERHLEAYTGATPQTSR